MFCIVYGMLVLRLNHQSAIFKRNVLFSSYVISDRVISTDKSKVYRIVFWPTPNKSFSGLPSIYYRHYIEDFATITWPLHCLTEKKTPSIGHQTVLMLLDN